jgi:hypothetical protein
MTDFAYTGKKGTGKSKNVVRIIRDTYFAEKRRVATNLDIFLEPMYGKMSKQTYVRVPDKPSEFDLMAAGHGNPDTYDEEKAGFLALDEMATWMNTRTFADKDRGGTLNFFAHARKYGWDVGYIMQNIVQVDKQLRESFIEIVVRHTRFDKVKIPFIGGLICTLFGKRAGYFPRFHTAVSRIGLNPMDLKTDSSMFTGRDIEKCYDTRQVFEAAYPHGTHSVLSPWHVTGRYLPVPPTPWLTQFWNAARGGFQPPKRVCRQVTRPDAGYLRVLALARRLPPAEAVAVIARYQRHLDKRLLGYGACPMVAVGTNTGFGVSGPNGSRAVDA